MWDADCPRFNLRELFTITEILGEKSTEKYKNTFDSVFF